MEQKLMQKNSKTTGIGNRVRTRWDRTQKANTWKNARIKRQIVMSYEALTLNVERRRLGVMGGGDRSIAGRRLLHSPLASRSRRWSVPPKGHEAQRFFAPSDKKSRHLERSPTRRLTLLITSPRLVSFLARTQHRHRPEQVRCVALHGVFSPSSSPGRASYFS